MKSEVTLFWFRRDLRLRDNHGLFKALKSGKKVLPIFIFDTDILKRLPKNDARLSFIYDQLQSIRRQLQKEHHASVALFYGKPLEIFEQLIQTHKIAAVYTNHDYEPYARQRDAEIRDLLNDNSIAFRTFKDQVIFEKDEIQKDDGKPYVVYTPYMRKWKARFRDQGLEIFPSEAHLDKLVQDPHLHNLKLEALDFERSEQKIHPYNDSVQLIKEYEARRNFPAIDGTSRLGPHLRFGTVSIRDMVDKAASESNEVFWQELIWREFFMQILWHFPQTVSQSFRPKYDRIEWRNNEAEFKAWCQGRTGYPLVDAGMRELNATGFMHNRLRMLVGSFLCKHLLIDWRWGEAYFAEKLHDYEQASNVGNWQWAAGSGVDAAPYFRIFNPTTQIDKFDTDRTYIKRWVPEFKEDSYPDEIVDHKMARERCLSVYKSALN